MSTPTDSWAQTCRARLAAMPAEAYWARSRLVLLSKAGSSFGNRPLDNLISRRDGFR
jgi:hypothetical protein